MKNYFDICFRCNETEFCNSCSQPEICTEFTKCFKHNPYKMWGSMASFDDILKCVEKWRKYNEQTTKQ